MRSMPNDEPSYEILRALRRILRRVNEHSRMLARESGMTVPQVLALKAVAELELATPAVVARAIQLTPSTTTAVLDRLEGAGMIRRERSPDDRRKVLLVLTDEGRERAAKLPPPLQERFLERLDAIEALERGKLLDALDRIVELMDASDVDAAPLLSGEPVKPRR